MQSWNIMSDSEDEDSPDTGAGDTSGWPEYRVDPNNGAIGLGRDGEHPSPFHKPSATQQNSFSDRRSPDPVRPTSCFLATGPFRVNLC